MSLPVDRLEQRTLVSKSAYLKNKALHKESLPNLPSVQVLSQQTRGDTDLNIRNIRLNVRFSTEKILKNTSQL